MTYVQVYIVYTRDSSTVKEIITDKKKEKEKGNLVMVNNYQICVYLVDNWEWAVLTFGHLSRTICKSVRHFPICSVEFSIHGKSPL
jgi:hypothetical protein